MIDLLSEEAQKISAHGEVSYRRGYHQGYHKCKEDSVTHDYDDLSKMEDLLCDWRNNRTLCHEPPDFSFFKNDLCDPCVQAGYRRGYLTGYAQMVEYMKDGITVEKVEEFMNKVVMKWMKEKEPSGKVVPPFIYEDESINIQGEQS